MKAAVLYGNEDIRYADWETPVCRPGTVKIRVNRIYEPDPAVKEIYDRGYETYRKLYGNLKDLMNA